VKATVFLGGGRITAALLAGLRLAKHRQPILVYDRHPPKLRQLRKLYGAGIEQDLHRAVAQARLLIIAVRPSSVADLLREVGKLDRPLAAVSLAAGVPLAKLRPPLGPLVRWARAMPSPLCRGRKGLTALTFDRHFPASARRQIERLFAEVGVILEIPERQMDAFTVAYSPSHGYHALAALAAAAEKLGLDRPTAMTAAIHALADAIVACREGQVLLPALLHEAATPGGTAAAVMDAMDRHGYRRAVDQGLIAGLKRARENAKET
jgi:pyrroline-5-carboxylate reductase